VVLDVDFDREPVDASSQLRILTATEQIAPHPIAAHPRVPKKVMSKVTQSLLSIAADPGGRDLLRTVRMTDPIRADYARDYKPLENLDINSLANEF
jgi:phosphonate transport system substrate-binding protein